MSKITVRWHWGLPPFVASYTDRRGQPRGVARWTPWAAYARAFWLRSHYIGMLLDLAGRDLEAGRFADADEIMDYVRAVYQETAP